MGGCLNVRGSRRRFETPKAHEAGNRGHDVVFVAERGLCLQVGDKAKAVSKGYACYAELCALQSMSLTR